MNPISLVTNALEYYDNNNEIYKDVFNNVYYIKYIEGLNDLDHNQILFYDKHKNELFRSKYEIIGLYNFKSNAWIWAWSIPQFKKNNTNIIRKLWNYGAVLDQTANYLKTELITSRFRVSNKIQLDIHVSLASYLSKNPLVYHNYIYNQSENDTDLLLPIKNNDIKLDDDYTIYFMFLLDYKNIHDKKLYL